MDEVLIRDVAAEDRAAWRELWDAYLMFYEADLPPSLSEFLWQRFFDPGDPVACVVAEVVGEPVGIAHFFAHPDTWEEGPICYLQDLFVAESHRGRGVGRALILEVHRRSRAEGWRLLHWQTKADNARARILYDKLAGGPNGFVGYDMEVPPRW
jgi:GNAT superfamily N-acetyltransferase